MYKCIDKVVGEIIETKNKNLLLNICKERKYDYGSRADLYKLDDNTYEITYMS